MGSIREFIGSADSSREYVEFGNVPSGDPQRCSHRTRELLVTLNNLARSQEFEGLFVRIRRFLHPADDGKSSIDRKQTFPFRKKGRPTTQTA